jgi:ABC-type molybdenum transport system ATPase subunit/photorepair protein PhrA
MAVLIELIDELALSNIICGMPLSLLTPPEQRLLMIVGSILNASKARPRLVMLEEPFTGLSREQIVGLRRIFTLPSLSERVGWLLISG